MRNVCTSKKKRVQHREEPLRILIKKKLQAQPQSLGLERGSWAALAAYRAPLANWSTPSSQRVYF